MRRNQILKLVLTVGILLAIVVCALIAADGSETGGFRESGWALLPPAIAIALALVTKEVYSSLLIGIVFGGLLYSNFGFDGTINHVLNDGVAAVLSDRYNVGILVFLVILGTMVCLMNRAGGSAAFGRWASRHIKTRVGAQLATIALGVLIFIDDYFNCLTVGSVMRPVTDKHNISRAKLAYLIDATAAPVCIIAPVSSWAAAVSSYVAEGNGLRVFIQAIPFNLYALLTIAMMILMAVFRLDFGPMAKQERSAENGDVASGLRACTEAAEETANPRGCIADLLAPIAVLIVSCVAGMLYSGGFFSGTDFVAAFSGSDASVGLMIGSAGALVFTLVYYACRRLMSFRELMGCIPEGFQSMVPAILILTFAWSLKAMTDSLGAASYVAGLVRSSAGGLRNFLPAVVFLIGCGLSFATGTSWGTFGILIPITLDVFPLSDPIGIVCVSACMAGAVCGDHCSPISDTTIMASAGAQCDHVTHVSTQLPYAIVAAAVSFAGYLLAGFVPNAAIVLPAALALLIAVLLTLRALPRSRS